MNSEPNETHLIYHTNPLQQLPRIEFSNFKAGKPTASESSRTPQPNAQ